MENKNQLVAIKPFKFVPATYDESMKYADLLAKSDMVPKDYKGKVENTFVAIQMGAELGLSPLQALQNIAVINGKPTVYGVAMLAIVQAHPDYEWSEEFFEGEGDQRKAVFKIKRRGEPVHTAEFSIERAKKAKLWTKPGPWTDYPEDMQMWRARTLGCKAKFSDALKGLTSAEEARDYVNVTPPEDAPKQSYTSKADDLLRKMGATVEPTITDVPAEEVEVVEDSEDEDSRMDKIGLIYEMIDRYKVSEQAVSSWLAKAGVSSFSALDEDMLDKFIDSLKQGYENK
jgi:hypothetical protein